MTPPNNDYWNHNTAYHPWLTRIAAGHRGDVLDVGCGDDLLSRLAPVSRSVTAIDPESNALQRAYCAWPIPECHGDGFEISTPENSGTTSSPWLRACTMDLRSGLLEHATC